MSNMWCEEHWKPFAAREANGVAAQAFLMLFVTRDERWLSLIDRGDGVSDTSPAGMDRAMAKIAPACCWIPHERMEALLIASRECNPVDTEHLSGGALAKAQVDAFNLWRKKNRGELN